MFDILKPRFHLYRCDRCDRCFKIECVKLCTSLVIKIIHNALSINTGGGCKRNFPNILSMTFLKARPLMDYC